MGRITVQREINGENHIQADKKSCNRGKKAYRLFMHFGMGTDFLSVQQQKKNIT